MQRSNLPPKIVESKGYSFMDAITMTTKSVNARSVSFPTSSLRMPQISFISSDVVSKSKKAKKEQEG
jgi:hypothetical protein